MMSFDTVCGLCVTQDDVELPRDPVKLDIPPVLRQVLQRDRHLIKVKHMVSCSCCLSCVLTTQTLDISTAVIYSTL